MIVFLLACHVPASSAPAAELEGLHLGPERVCASPVEAADRLQLADRGLDHVRVNEGQSGPCNVPSGATVARDLDLDGDPDLVVLDRDGVHALWDNQRGQLHEVALDLPGEELYALGAADLDGDGLPELVATGLGQVLVAPNLGQLRFGPWQSALEEQDWPRSCYASMSFGDVDLDGDLDLSVAGLDLAVDPEHVAVGDPSSGELEGAPDLLLLNEGGQLQQHADLDSELPRLSMVHHWTDRDQDGDLDLLAGTDRFVEGMVGMGTSLRNDGSGAEGPLLFEDGHEIGFFNAWAAMGLSSWDLNDDGLLDHCVSDFGDRLRCVLADGLGGFYTAGQGLSTDFDEVYYVTDVGLAAPDPELHVWVPWGLQVSDLDADGYEDVLAVAGPLPEHGNTLNSPVTPIQPDALWMGGPEGFSLQPEAAWVQEDWHYSLVEVDLDGDGYRELIKGVDSGSPQVFDNPCGDNAWLEVEVLEPEGHVAFGAQVRVLHQDRSWMREIQSVRAFGQSQAAAHFGLGEAESVALEVRWPDGHLASYEEVPVNRRVTLSRP